MPAPSNPNEPSPRAMTPEAMRLLAALSAAAARGDRDMMAALQAMGRKQGLTDADFAIVTGVGKQVGGGQRGETHKLLKDLADEATASGRRRAVSAEPQRNDGAKPAGNKLATGMKGTTAFGTPPPTPSGRQPTVRKAAPPDSALTALRGPLTARDLQAMQEGKPADAAAGREAKADDPRKAINEARARAANFGKPPATPGAAARTPDGKAIGSGDLTREVLGADVKSRASHDDAIDLVDLEDVGERDEFTDTINADALAIASSLQASPAAAAANVVSPAANGPDADFALPPPLDTSSGSGGTRGGTSSAGAQPDHGASGTAAAVAFPPTMAVPAQPRRASAPQPDSTVLDPSALAAFTATDSGGYTMPGEQPWLGPFDVDGIYFDTPMSGLYRVIDRATKQACTARVFAPRRVSSRGVRRVVSRLALEASTRAHSPVVDSLSKVYAVDFFKLARHRDRSPDVLNREPKAQFGLIEEDRRLWRTLMSWLRDSARPTLIDRITVARQVARTLGDLRDRGLPHNEFDETRVFITARGRAKVAGWAWAGCFRADSESAPQDELAEDDERDEHGHEDSTAFNRRTWYRPPEVYLRASGPGDDRSTGRSDVYALGVLLFRLATFQLPPEWEACATLMDSIQAIENGLQTRPRQIAPSLPESLDTLICKATNADPALRHADAHEIAADLERILRKLVDHERTVVAPLVSAQATPASVTGACQPFASAPPVPPVGLPESYRHVQTMSVSGLRSLHKVQHRQTGGIFALRLYVLPRMSMAPANKNSETRDGSTPTATQVKLAARRAANEFAMHKRCHSDLILTLQDHGSHRADSSELGLCEVKYLVYEWAAGWPLGGGTTTTIQPQAVPEQEVANLCRTPADLARPLSETVVVWILQQVLRALHACHDAGIVHYDVKPANLLCFPRGGLKLGDFGVANYADGFGSAPQDGQVFGTPAYLSPEQLLPPGAPVAASDLFAVGACAYEMLTGQPPFELISGDDGGKIPVHRPVADPRNAGAACSDTVANLVVNLLALDSRKRVQTASAAFEQLKASPVHPVSWATVQQQLSLKS